MSESTKRFRRGEVLIRENEREGPMYLVKSGQVTLVFGRGKGQGGHGIEVVKLGPGQIVGERNLLGASGPGPSGMSIVASSDVDVLVMPQEWVRPQVDGAPQLPKLLLKALSERATLLLNQIKDLLADKDPRPCPEDSVAHVFGALYIFAKLKGTPKKDDPKGVEVDWLACKQFSQRILTVLPSRLEQAAKILQKLKLGELHMEVVDDPKVKKMLEKNPSMDPADIPKELRKVTLYDRDAVERFVDFFQNTHFKALNREALKVDDRVATFLRELLRLAEKETVVRMDFKKTMTAIQEVIGTTSVDYFTLLESKGLFAKRESTPAGTLVVFYVSEFKEALLNWAILKEIDKWNEKGFVDLDEENRRPTAAQKANEQKCPACETMLQEAHKFCPNCGAARAQAA